MSSPEELAKLVLFNLENQHDWAELKTHGENLPRPIISGLPPRRLYVHPDEQIEIIQIEKKEKIEVPQPPEFEWVLPLHLTEKWSIQRFAEVFDAIDAVPPGKDPLESVDSSGNAQWKKWRSLKRGKRILLAAVQDDSTVNYYLMHEGIVKPRQN